MIKLLLDMLLILLGFPCIIIFYVLEIRKSDGVTMTVVISLFAWVSAAHSLILSCRECFIKHSSVYDRQ